MKKVFWILLAHRMDPAVPAVAATLAWNAEDAGAEFEMYLENERDGSLFARGGSTTLGGHHFQQFNYLCAAGDVRALVLGDAAVFRSSLETFGIPVLAEAVAAPELYDNLGIRWRGRCIPVPCEEPSAGRPDLRPYFYQEIYFSRQVGVPQGPCPDEEYRSFTVRMADRWIDRAQGVAFGDPDVILSLIATLCREKRVAVYGACRYPDAGGIQVSGYTEAKSEAAGDVRRLAAMTGNHVIIGRQTCDGDIIDWSSEGVCIRIVDPNRPPFPVVSRVPYRWGNRTRTVFDHEPDDATLDRWADEGRVLTSLLIHSGESAHNEAMLNFVELCSITGLKLGIGVHADRYEDCPQLWETISVPKDRGGALGLIEPVLHSGGCGVMAEHVCPAEMLATCCRTACERIARIAGSAWVPRGYLCFMDSDMATFTATSPAVYAAIAGTGLEYTVSSALPGRNRVLWQHNGHMVLNQTSRVIASASPYVRISTVEDLLYTTPWTGPGWWMGVIDAPVTAFAVSLWRTGNRFMELAEGLSASGRINVTPRVIWRYARILGDRGLLPPAAGGPSVAAGTGSG